MKRDGENHAVSRVTGQKSETEITDELLPETGTRETQQGCNGERDARCFRVSSVRLHPITRRWPLSATVYSLQCFLPSVLDTSCPLSRRSLLLPDGSFIYSDE